MADAAIDDAALDARLREAAGAGDAAALARAYRLAAGRAAATGAAAAAGFYLTQAYVWALVAGDGPLAEQLAQGLRRSGRLD